MSLRYTLEGRMSGTNFRQVRIKGEFLCYVEDRREDLGFWFAQPSINDGFRCIGQTAAEAVDKLLAYYGYMSRKDWYEKTIQERLGKLGGGNHA